MQSRSSMIQAFLDYLQHEKRYATHTLKSYRADLLQFETYLQMQYEINDLKKVHAVYIRSWLVYLIDKGLSNKSLNRKLSSLKSFYKFALRRDLLSQNPASKIVAPKVKKRLPEVVRADDLRKDFDWVNCFDFEILRNHIVVELLYQTGMRRAELIALKISDVSFTQSKCKALGKGNKERNIPIGQELLLMLKHYLKIREAYLNEQEQEAIKESYLPEHVIITLKGKKAYPKMIYRIVTEDLTKSTTNKKKSPHVLRHSFATHLLDSGAELNAVKELLGHSSLAATQIYTHNSIKQLKDLYKRAHPKGA